MGVCGLHTEKVGLPIEKALTVKNEGTVSVSLTLSAAAPYKVVSVLPTLSPGQSAQVTLRFDPNESGSFSGNVQVGINGGQGSVTAPLAGVAHKIEISPAELNFGLIFVGSTTERKLTVKNQGMTTVTLEVPNTTQNTASPFRIMVESMPGSPLVLGPGESTGVPVQFSATASGTFSENVQLVAGSVSFKVPVRAWAITYEEYLQALLTGANTLAQYGGAYNVAIAESWRNPCLQVLSGFDNLSTEIIQGYVNSAECEDIAGIDLARLAELQRAFELLEALGADRIISWLHTLKQAIAEGRFDEEYARLLPEGLDQFIETMRLFSDLTNAEEVKNQLRAWLVQQEQIDPLAYAHLLQDSVNGVLIRLPGGPTLVLLFNESVRSWWDQLITRLMTLPGFSSELYRASNALYWICVSISNLDLPGALNTFRQLHDFLKWMDSAQRIEQGLGTLLAAGNAASRGWQVIGFKPITAVDRTAWTAELTMTAQRAYELRILIPMTRLGPDGRPYNLTGIRVVVLGHHCEQCGLLTQQIVEWVREALKQWSETFTTNNQLTGDLNVFIISFTRENPEGVHDVINALSAEFGSVNAVIMVVWIENGEVKWACISAGCRFLTPEEEAIAESFANLLSKYPSRMIETLMGFCGGDVGCVISLLMAGK
jgi:hypothetical protein